MPPVLKPKEKPKTDAKAVAYRGPAELVAAVDEAAAAMGLSRNEAMTQLLEFALAAHRKEQTKSRKA